MNKANLQLERLYLAIASLNKALVAKNVLLRNEVERALHEAEAAATGEDHFGQLSPANRDAVCFPIRALRLANAGNVGTLPTFSELAKSIGETKEPYNDQR